MKFKAKKFTFYLQPKSVQTVAPGVLQCALSMVNAFMLSNDDGSWVLVDTGFQGDAGSIKRMAEANFGKDNPPTAIVLTHGHLDHTGTIKKLLKTWKQVPVYAHQLELPYLTGRSAYPPADPGVGGGLVSSLSRFFPNKPINLRHRIHPLPADGSVPGLIHWRYLHTPGHTPGHISFFRPADGVLIAGDAIVTTNTSSLWASLNKHKKLSGPPPYFTCDWNAARQSVKRLAALNPSVIASGHGNPMQGEKMQEALRNLAENFDQIAIPKKGRYIHYPALADETGIISLPPAPIDPMPKKVLAGVAIASLTGIVLYTLLKKQKATRNQENNNK